MPGNPTDNAHEKQAFPRIYKPHALLLAVLCLLLCFMQCNGLLQPKVVSSEMEVLHTLYNSTGGSIGAWNFTSINSILRVLKTTENIYFCLGLIGRDWNFTKSVQGAYLEDPCPTANSPPFTGVNCSCDALSCRISAIAVPLGNLTASTIPPALGQLTHLTLLDLSANAFHSEIPASLGNLTQLSYLYLIKNQLTSSIPASLGNLALLQDLNLDDNQLTSSIPASLGNLKSLVTMYVTRNSLSGSIPASLGNLQTSLRFLNLAENRLSGSIPSSLGNLSNLVLGLFFANSLSGNIPDSLGNLKQVVFLRLERNRLSGSMPSSLGRLKQNLQNLHVGSNSLSGLIPPELGNIGGLNELSINENSFIGPIPSSLGQLTQLTHLDLSSNMLSGIVPPDFANLVNLQQFLMHGNQLGGGMSSAGENAFSFINPAKQVNLAVLDISSNAFEGPLSESIFALPSLEVFVAGSNCFSGSLPSNLCAGTKLRVLSIAGLSSGESCRRMYWKGAFFTRALGFNGFGADHFMQGSLSQCVYGMPNLNVLSAAGNAFHGQAPSLEGSMSASLQIDVSRNRLTGSITNEIASAMLTGGNLKMLKMAYNRISGDLSAFSGVGDELSFNAAVALSLEVNRLSGVIPQSLRNLQQISILTGNVFQCSADRAELPKGDTPAIDSYQCDSKPMNNMMYAFAAFAFALIVLWEMLFRRISLRFHFRAMRTLLLTAEDIGATSKEFPLTNIARYSHSMSELRRFVCIVGVALLIVLIVYGALSGGRYRTLEHTYLWVTTAAYMTGTTSAAWLLTIGVCMTTLTCYLVTENIWRTKAADVVKPEGSGSADHTSSGTAQSSASESRWMWLRIRLLPMLRLIILIMVVWGVIAATNVWYLKVLLNGSPQTQEMFKFAFAAFKLVWTSVVTPMAFKSKLLFFGLEEERHNAFLDFWLGGEAIVMLTFNAVSTFGIPLLVVMVDKIDCFRNVFVAAAPIGVQFAIEQCISFNTFSSECVAYKEYTYVSEQDVPFLYNYTCSSSMIRAYVPLYQQMLMMLIAMSCLQIMCICLDISAAEQGNLSGCVANLWGFLKAVVPGTLPTSNLILNSSQRMGGYKNGVIFGMLSPVWITKHVPAQFSNLLILVTFGVWAPLLGAIAVLAIVLDTYVSQLVIGRFLVVELGVVQEHKLELGLILPDSRQLDTRLNFSSARHANMRQDIQDCDKPWGAVAVLKEVEEQCAHWPASVLAQGRTVLVVVPAITMAFLILDVINGSDIGDSGPTYWPSIFLVCYACVLEFSARLYKCYRLDRSRRTKTITESPTGSIHGSGSGECVDVGIVLVAVSSQERDQLAGRLQRGDGGDASFKEEVRPRDAIAAEVSANPLHAFDAKVTSRR